MWGWIQRTGWGAAADSQAGEGRGAAWTRHSAEGKLRTELRSEVSQRDGYFGQVQVKEVQIARKLHNKEVDVWIIEGENYRE